MRTQRDTLEKLKAEYLSLPSKRQQKLQQLETGRRQAQMNAYLDTFSLWRAYVAGIGTSRKATLQAYGIETALDIVEANVLSVPGFGPSLTGNLLGWRHSLEANFVFNPSKPVDPAEIARIDSEIISDQKRLEQQLQYGLGQLRVMSQGLDAHRQSLIQRANHFVQQVAQAQIDFDYL